MTKKRLTALKTYTMRSALTRSSQAHVRITRVVLGAGMQEFGLRKPATAVSRLTFITA